MPGRGGDEGQGTATWGQSTRVVPGRVVLETGLLLSGSAPVPHRWLLSLLYQGLDPRVDCGVCTSAYNRATEDPTLSLDLQLPPAPGVTHTLPPTAPAACAVLVQPGHSSLVGTVFHANVNLRPHLFTQETSHGCKRRNSSCGVLSKTRCP